MTPEQLDLRLTRLESSASRWKLATCSLLLLALLTLTLGQGIVITGGGPGKAGGMKAPAITSDTVTINKSLTLNDSNGTPRLILSTENDIPSLKLKDKDNTTLLTIALEKDAATLLIQDPTGKKLYAAP